MQCNCEVRYNTHVGLVYIKMDHITNSQNEVIDEVDNISPFNSHTNSLERNPSKYLAFKPFEAEQSKHNDLIINSHSRNTLKLKQLEDYLAARMVVLKADEFIPVHRVVGDDSYIEREGNATLDTDYTQRKNMAQYHLALIKQEVDPGKRQFIKLIFEGDPELLTDTTFLELYYKTDKIDRFQVNSTSEEVNGDNDTYKQYMHCNKVPVNVFEKYLAFLNEKNEILKLS